MQTNKKKYLFVSYTDFDSGKLTGAHRRFLELLTSVSGVANVVFVGRPSQKIERLRNVKVYPIDPNVGKKLPKHLAGGYSIYKTLRKNKETGKCDYAIAFTPITAIFCWMAGIKHIVSLFRENLIGYQQALLASKRKIAYFQLQERIAVKASEKIIVQCEDDRKNLIERNRSYCKKISDKVFVQINNANASWMNTECLARSDNGDTPKILFIGNFSDRRKGHFILLPAVIKLLNEGYKVELLCAGDGCELNEWKKKCDTYSEIHFLGHVSNMKEYLLQSDMLIVPSLIDSCPNTVLEGLNAGLAVYGANAGGIPDLLQDDAYMFSPDEDSIYAFLKEILDSCRYKKDSETQQSLKRFLSFDWGEKIRIIIES